MAKPATGEVKVVKKRLVSSVTKTKAQPKKPAQGALKKTAKTPNKVKEATKHVVVKSLADDVRKIAIIENITKRAPVPVAPLVHKTFPKTESIRSRFVVALPAIFREDQAMLVSNVARYTGTFFVVMGAFLTLYSMSTSFPFLDTPALLTAQTATSSLCSGDTCNTYTAPISNTINTTNTQPTADIKVESASNLLKGIVPVNVTVPLATRVDLVAKRSGSTSFQSIGSMSKVGDLAWRGYWKTTGFDDGVYQVKATIVNQHGSYSVVAPNDFVIENNPLETVAPTPSEETTNTTSASSTQAGTTGSTDQNSTNTVVATTTTVTTIANPTPTTTTTLPPIAVDLDDESPVDGIVAITVNVKGASVVKVLSRAAGAATFTILGYATLLSDGDWEYSWDTTKQADGKYDVRVQAIFQNSTSNSKLLTGIAIENAASGALESSTTTTVTTLTETAVIEPSIVLNLSKANPLQDIVDVYVTAKVTSIELYVIADKSLTPQFVGRAEKLSESGWRYQFDTKRIPNGIYKLYAEAKHAYGFSKSEPRSIQIQNIVRIENTPEETTYLDTLEQAGKEVVAEMGIAPEETSDATVALAKPVFYEALLIEIDDEHKDSSEALFSQFKVELDSLMIEYGKALRENDQETVRTLQNKLEELRARVIQDLPFGAEKESIVTRINEHLGTVIKDLRERIERSETLIRDRVGDAVTKDSDMDGVSDYDEVNLYKTDALSADTDQDGFMDGIEILNGYDPLDNERQANVQYESPEDEGVERSDLITIDHITSVQNKEGNEPPQALIGGKALPNSFVTLYIFSTPIVVTVKTDRDGNWSYLFDKELDNGEHKVYAGITDNAGQIVAKSSPLPFVKTAEAYAVQIPEETSLVAAASPEPSLLSLRALLIIGSLAVISLGLVLILLGLHVRPKQEPELVMA